MSPCRKHKIVFEKNVAQGRFCDENYTVQTQNKIDMTFTHQ